MSGYDELLAKIPKHEQDDVRELAESVLFMRRKLEESRLAMESEPIVIPYDNGGGQAGIRANPAYSEYEKLMKCYTSTLSTLREILGARADAKYRVAARTVVGNSKWKARASG